MLHPHVGTMVENTDDVRRVLDGSSIALCLDTGHLLIGGTDPVAAHPPGAGADRAHPRQGRRPRAGHAGPERAADLHRGRARGHVPPGRARRRRLRRDHRAPRAEHGYGGWYVLEQDTILVEEPVGEGPLTRRAARASRRCAPSRGPVTEPLRIGVLGAARITGQALVGPAKETDDRLVVVAARDPRRAAAFAAEHGVERVVDVLCRRARRSRGRDRLQPAGQRAARPVEPRRGTRGEARALREAVREQRGGGARGARRRRSRGRRGARGLPLRPPPRAAQAAGARRLGGARRRCAASRRGSPCRPRPTTTPAGSSSSPAAR